MKKRNVRILDSINAIRTRPGQYIGDTSNCNHIIHEAIDNVLDELRNGYGNQAGIAFNKNKEILIFDNGRGLPYGTSIDEESGEEIDSITALFTKLHSGTKFSHDDDNLDSLFGQNGVGLVALNALSEYVEVKTQNDKTGAHRYLFKDSVLEIKEEIDPIQFSTEIIFKPSKKYFDSIIPNKELFLERLLLSQSKINNSKFFFNNKELKNNSLDDFVRNKLKLSKDTPLFKCELSTKKFVIKELNGKEFKMSGNISLFLTYEPGNTIICGDVNLRFCEGTFLTNIQSLLKNIIPSKINKKFQKTPERFLVEGLRLYASLQVPFPRFDSQTKTRMVSDVKNELILPLEPKISKLLNDTYIITTIEKILSQKLGNLNKIVKTKKISSDNKLLDCIKRPGNILYIVEGDSAMAPIRDCRNSDTEAVLPLRGKIINVEKQSLAKIKENKEIKNIIEALGTGPNYRYDKVKIICDADSDGLHINVLVTLIFAKYYKDLIDAGKVSIVLPPLYGAIKKDQFIPLYDIESTNEYKSKGFEIQRFKGLGEMASIYMRQILDNEIEYVIRNPESDDLFNNLINIITDSNEKRKYLEMKNEYNFENFISQVFNSLNKE